MSHHVTHMIELKYLSKPRSRVFNKAYAMRVQGFPNMLTDAQRLHERVSVHYWKIIQTEVATGAVVATLASGGAGTVTNISPLVHVAEVSA